VPFFLEVEVLIILVFLNNLVKVPNRMVAHSLLRIFLQEKITQPQGIATLALPVQSLKCKGAMPPLD